jgi:curved DNA-binding protein CbpA
MKHHPDKGGAEEDFKKIGMAWEVLQDLAKRAAYDKFSRFGAQYQAPASPPRDPPPNGDQPPDGAAGKEARELPQDRSNTVLGWQKNSQKISSGFVGKGWLKKVLVATRSSVPTSPLPAALINTTGLLRS